MPNQDVPVEENEGEKKFTVVEKFRAHMREMLGIDDDLPAPEWPELNYETHNEQDAPREHAIKCSDIYSWGSDSCGQLGLNVNRNIWEPTLLKTLKFADFEYASHPGYKIACGFHHAAAVSDIGCFTWGSGEYGQLGHGENTNSNIPKLVEALSSRRVRRVACGSYHTIALTDQGAVYTWGRGKNGRLGRNDDKDSNAPGEVETLRQKQITQVSAGGTHTAALTGMGELYMWGGGMAGQLGIGDKHDQKTPLLINALLGKMIYMVSCGEHHTAALTDSGEVYTWGFGVHGRLGHGDETSQSTPRRVEDLNGKRIVGISCGGYHTAALGYNTADGHGHDAKDVWTWGFNGYGQLGHGDTKDQFRPRKVKALTSRDISQVICGSWHTAAIAGCGLLYTWGWGEEGQLGHAQEQNVKVPSVVRKLLKKRVVQVGCGWSHTLAITAFELNNDKRMEEAAAAATAAASILLSDGGAGTESEASAGRSDEDGEAESPRGGGKTRTVSTKRSGEISLEKMRPRPSSKPREKARRGRRARGAGGDGAGGGVDGAQSSGEVGGGRTDGEVDLEELLEECRTDGEDFQRRAGALGVQTRTGPDSLRLPPIKGMMSGQQLRALFLPASSAREGSAGDPTAPFQRSTLASPPSTAPFTARSYPGAGAQGTPQTTRGTRKPKLRTSGRSAGGSCDYSTDTPQTSTQRNPYAEPQRLKTSPRPSHPHADAAPKQQPRAAASNANWQAEHMLESARREREHVARKIADLEAQLKPYVKPHAADADGPSTGRNPYEPQPHAPKHPRASADAAKSPRASAGKAAGGEPEVAPFALDAQEVIRSRAYEMMDLVAAKANELLEARVRDAQQRLGSGGDAAMRDLVRAQNAMSDERERQGAFQQARKLVLAEFANHLASAQRSPRLVA